jgi:hypothetical protein
VQNRRMRATLVSAVAGLVSVAGSARAATYGVAMFGGQGIVLDGANVTGGALVTNGSLNGNASIGNTGPLFGAGSLYATGGSGTVAGPITFNQNVSIGFGTFSDQINSGGNVVIGGGNYAANISAAGSVTQKGTDTGNIAAGGNLTVDGTVNGNATYGGTYTLGTLSSVNGTVTQSSAKVTPTAYHPIALPTDPFGGASPANGLPDLTQTGTAVSPITPGHYGAFQPNTFVGGAVYLTGGDYFFNSVDFLSGNVFSVNLVNVSSANPVRIFSAGDIQLGGLIGMTVNGFNTATTDPSLASDVLFESHGNVNFDQATSFIGTVFAPDGNVVLSGTTVVGSVFAGETVTDSGTLTYVPGANVGVTATVPEPVTAGLILVAALGLGMRRVRG